MEIQDGGIMQISTCLPGWQVTFYDADEKVIKNLPIVCWTLIKMESENGCNDPEVSALVLFRGEPSQIGHAAVELAASYWEIELP